MAYTKQNFVNGTPLDASELNHIEDSIVALEQTLGNIRQEILNDIIAAFPAAEGGNF